MRFAKLTGPDNYKEWSRNMRNALCETGLWRIVTGQIVRPEDAAPSNATAAERKEHAKELLQWIIDDDRSSGKIKKMCVPVVQLQLEDEWSGKKIWEELKTLCQPSAWSNKWVIMDRLQAISLASSKDMQDYEVKTEKIEEEIQQLGITMNEFLVIKTINGLGPRYESWVMLLSQEARKENKLPTLKQLFGHLRQEEHRMSLSKAVTAANRVQTGSYQPGSPNANSHRGRGGARGRGESRGGSRGRGGRGGSQANQSNQNDGNHSLKDIECYQCGKKGHIKKLSRKEER